MIRVPKALSLCEEIFSISDLIYSQTPRIPARPILPAETSRLISLLMAPSPASTDPSFGTFALVAFLIYSGSEMSTRADPH